MNLHATATRTIVAILVFLAVSEFPQQHVNAEKHIAATKDIINAEKAHARVILA